MKKKFWAEIEVEYELDMGIPDAALISEFVCQSPGVQANVYEKLGDLVKEEERFGVMLHDEDYDHHAPTPRILEATVILESGGIAVGFDGYGLKEMLPGAGSPIIFIEYYGGRPRVHLWLDINEADPNTFDLDRAHEFVRDDKPEDEPNE